MTRGMPGRAGYRTVLLVAGSLLAGHGRGIAANGSSAPQGPEHRPERTASPRAAILAVHGEDHANFGRIDIDADNQARYGIVRDGDRVSIRFEMGTSLSEPDRLPRNVQAAKVSGKTLDLTLAHGAAIHPLRTRGHIIFDIYDVPAGAKPTAAEPAAMTQADHPSPAEAAKVDTAPRMPVTQDARAVKPQSPAKPQTQDLAPPVARPR